MGMWVILPFAGLEMAALASGLYICSARSLQREVISVNEDTVLVEFGRSKPVKSVTFQRAWTSIELRPAAIKGHSAKLELRSMGKSVEIGACLTDSEKKELARSLALSIAKGPL